MGLFGKIKNILFEDEEEEEKEMPVYTKEEVAEAPKKAEAEEKPVPVVEEPIKTSDSSQFRNVKRDIDLSFDEKDVLGEIPGAKEALVPTGSEIEQERAQKIEEKKSIFPSFDEAEFERLNSRINRNESKVRKEVRNIGAPVNNAVNVARVANNNFSATSTSAETRVQNNERYKVNAGTLGSGKKPFTPSPVISPVYGILDKNYTKDDIVDKKGGLKREKVVKPIAKKEEIEIPKVTEYEESTSFEVDIDSVRKKAYGELEELEKTFANLEIPELKEEIKDFDVEEISEIEVETIASREAALLEEEKELSIEEQLDEKFEVPEILPDVNEEEKELDKVVEDVIEAKIPEKKKEKSKPQLMDELEKTSTLQILDDIEKELNSIKPMTSSKIDDDEDFTDKALKNSDTLENDLFNLIDSMYEEGEEEEDSD